MRGFEIAFGRNGVSGPRQVSTAFSVNFFSGKRQLIPRSVLFSDRLGGEILDTLAFKDGESKEAYSCILYFRAGTRMEMDQTQLYLVGTDHSCVFPHLLCLYSANSVEERKLNGDSGSG